MSNYFRGAFYPRTAADARTWNTFNKGLFPIRHWPADMKKAVLGRYAFNKERFISAVLTYARSRQTKERIPFTRPDVYRSWILQLVEKILVFGNLKTFAPVILNTIHRRQV